MAQEANATYPQEVIAKSNQVVNTLLLLRSNFVVLGGTLKT